MAASAPPHPIAALRHAHGLSQERLEALAGVAEPTIRAAERGRRTPELATLERLAPVLGVTVGELAQAISDWRSAVGLYGRGSGHP